MLSTKQELANFIAPDYNNCSNSDFSDRALKSYAHILEECKVTNSVDRGFQLMPQGTCLYNSTAYRAGPRRFTRHVPWVYGFFAKHLNPKHTHLTQ